MCLALCICSVIKKVVQYSRHLLNGPSLHCTDCISQGNLILCGFFYEISLWISLNGQRKILVFSELYLWLGHILGPVVLMRAMEV